MVQKLSKVRRIMRLAHLVNLLFVLFVVIYYCLELNIETQTIFWNLRNLLLCTPYILLYLLLECWLFPNYVRKRRVRVYAVVCLILVVAISVIWTFLIRPHITEEVNISYFSFLRWTVCFLMCLTIFFVVTANNMFAFSFQIEREQEHIVKTKLQLELNLLKYQINPHFLMNTLNNIHALIEEDKEAAQNALRLLSKMMRYMYYDNSQQRVPLAKDIEALHSYFELMRLRFINTVDIQFIVPKDIPNVSIAPNLFVNLAENAMKHGISTTEPSFVHFSLDVDDHFVNCKVSNSNFPHTIVADSTGFGLENLRKRLDLLYPKQYVYNVESTDSEYFVELKIPFK